MNPVVIVAAADVAIVVVFIVFALMNAPCPVGVDALSAWHAGHVLLIVLVFATQIDRKRLYQPVTIAAVGLLVFVIDAFVLGWRLAEVVSLTDIDQCLVLHLFLDVLFALVAFAYIAFAIVDVPSYGWFGVSSDDAPPQERAGKQVDETPLLTEGESKSQLVIDLDGSSAARRPSASAAAARRLLVKLAR